MRKYTTVSGDMWDKIAHSQMGDAMHKDKLMLANREHAHTYIFTAGIVLSIPEVPPEIAAGLPPWKQPRAEV
jgi:hypothetical protein